MMKHANIIFGTCFILVINSLYLKAQIATIDLTDTKQTISGFGGAHYPEWVVELTLDQVDKAFGNNPGQLGLDILRIPVPLDTSIFSMEVPAAARATSNGALVVASPWTPPPYMKTNNNANQGRLDTAYYDDYANYLDSFADYMAFNGAPLYAISLQNEPDITVTYASCLWTAAEMIDFLSNYGSGITSTKIMAAESYNFNHTFSDSILNDTSAEQELDIIAGHIYGGGLTDYPLARSKGKEVWMTEHYLPGTNWSGALAEGKEIHDCMIANFNAYIYWYLRRDNGFLSENGNISKKGYVMSQYSKFVRPGYTRVGLTTSSLTNIDVTAYKNDTNVVIVAINRNASPVNLKIALKNGTVYSFTKFVTSETKNVINDSIVFTSDDTCTATLAAQSITTFTTSPENGGRFGNIGPVADAGADETYTDTDNNGYETVMLDGSGSTDPDDSVSIYTWSEGGIQIASGKQPLVDIQTGVHYIFLTATDSDGATDLDSVTITVNMQSGVEEVHVWLEAECGTVGSLWNTSSNATASNGKYVVIKPGNNSTASASENSTDQVSFAFDVTEAGNYTVWGRCRVPSANDDSYWVKMDTSAWIMWNSITGGATFMWDDVHNSNAGSQVMVYSLIPGSHTLTFAYREDGAELDKIYITNTGTVPGGIGDTAKNCPAISSLSLFDNEGHDINIFPDPVKDQSVIEFTLDKTEYVNLSIIDMTGRVVAELVNSVVSAGKNRVGFNGSSLENGIYLCRFTTSTFSQTKQIMIIR
jgi:O-glycosyl hydrolase